MVVQRTKTIDSASSNIIRQREKSYVPRGNSIFEIKYWLKLKSKLKLKGSNISVDDDCHCLLMINVSINKKSFNPALSILNNMTVDRCLPAVADCAETRSVLDSPTSAHINVDY